jgi:hypothetical protein
MAFDRAGLARIGGGTKGNAPQVWTYKTNDLLLAVDAAGYFDNGATTNTGMRNHFAVGDVIFVHASADTIPTFGQCVVNSVGATGIIDVTNLANTNVDTD